MGEAKFGRGSGDVPARAALVRICICDQVMWVVVPVAESCPVSRARARLQA